MVTVVESAATDCPAAVVNAGQLIASVPAPGWPFARYTVPCTVVVLTACPLAIAPGAIASAHNTIPRPSLNHLSFMSFIPIASLFSLHFVNVTFAAPSCRNGPQRIGPPQPFNKPPIKFPIAIAAPGRSVPCRMGGTHAAGSSLRRLSLGLFFPRLPSCLLHLIPRRPCRQLLSQARPVLPIVVFVAILLLFLHQ